MPKNEEELNAIKERVDKLREELKELSNDELDQIAGGSHCFDFLNRNC